jgi:hypothetical protein
MEAVAMSLSLFIADGYTFRASHPGEPGVFPPFWFEYRPASPSESFEYTHAVTPDAGKAAAFAIISRQVTAVWVHADGLDRPATGPPIRLMPEQVERLHLKAFNAIFDHVMGYKGPNLERLEKNSGTASGLPSVIPPLPSGAALTVAGSTTARTAAS